MEYFTISSWSFSNIYRGFSETMLPKSNIRP